LIFVFVFAANVDPDGKVEWAMAAAAMTTLLTLWCVPFLFGAIAFQLEERESGAASVNVRDAPGSMWTFASGVFDLDTRDRATLVGVPARLGQSEAGDLLVLAEADLTRRLPFNVRIGPDRSGTWHALVARAPSSPTAWMIDRGVHYDGWRTCRPALRIRRDTNRRHHLVLAFDDRATRNRAANLVLAVRSGAFLETSKDEASSVPPAPVVPEMSFVERSVEALARRAPTSSEVGEAIRYLKTFARMLGARGTGGSSAFDHPLLRQFGLDRGGTRWARFAASVLMIVVGRELAARVRFISLGTAAPSITARMIAPFAWGLIGDVVLVASVIGLGSLMKTVRPLRLALGCTLINGLSLAGVLMLMVNANRTASSTVSGMRPWQVDFIGYQTVAYGAFVFLFVACAAASRRQTVLTPWVVGAAMTLGSAVSQIIASSRDTGPLGNVVASLSAIYVIFAAALVRGAVAVAFFWVGHLLARPLSESPAAGPG
jgi:hypothetical protein